MNTPRMGNSPIGVNSYSSPQSPLPDP